MQASDLDEDGNQESLTYAAGENLGMFVVEMATGEIRVGDRTNLDYEELGPNYEYTLEVVATDPSGESGTSTVTIMVINVNEAPELVEPPDVDNLAATTTPEIDSDDEESADYERRLSTYGATDDEDAAADPVINLNWALSGPDSEKFGLSTDVTSNNDRGACADRPNVSGDTVLLCFKSKFAPDYESPEDSNGDNLYNVTVVVTDSHDNATTRDLSVTVGNVEESGEVKLSNLVPEVGIPIRAELADKDGGERNINWEVVDHKPHDATERPGRGYIPVQFGCSRDLGSN